MKIFKAILSVVFTIALIWALDHKFGAVPPVGKFLNPGTGFWRNAEDKDDDIGGKLNLKGLQSAVTIRFDDDRIPHIFAQNDHDLYYAQGYITAKDRLWQMDIQTRSAAGRLAEVVGEKALEVDRYHRRMGMVYGAENTLKAIMKDPVMRNVINAYTDGVNAYINSLSPGKYPIEYKLLNYKPEQWKPINCAFLLKLMSETLAGGSNELAMTNVLNKFGAKVTQDLFPDRYMHEDPVIPAGTKWDFKPLPIPNAPANFGTTTIAGMHTRERVEGLGSNNWAISGNKTASGYPILANDPHLNLTYPSIWYQVQLSAPGVNVYGATLPGAPCVVIGFNNKISWGVTNVDADILDWYQVQFKDASRSEYKYNNQWKKVTKRIERIVVAGKPDVVDTVLYTRFGPVVYDNAQMAAKGRKNIPVGNALKWVAHQESDEFKTFYLLNRGSNYADYRNALQCYAAPAQNFVFASNDNDIAITPNGRLPLKYKDQGKYIMDGSNPANDWQGWIPYEQNPTVKNPPRGFVSSANQASTDATYPYYINWQFAGYERAKRINDRLGVMQQATVDSMRNLQTDAYSIRAQDILPTMISYIDVSKLDANQTAALNILKQWDKNFSVDSEGASLFAGWWSNFYQAVWADDFASGKEQLEMPSMDRTEALLLREPNSTWFDNSKTLVKESAADILSRSFNVVVDELVKKNGKPGNWQWGKVKKFEVAHVANIPGFGSGNFASAGTGSTVNALTDGHGPSWRMVVQMGPQVKGYGIIPGGQSGNPGSFYYDNMLPVWKAGKLNELLFLQKPDQPSPRIKNTLTLTK